MRHAEHLKANHLLMEGHLQHLTTEQTWYLVQVCRNEHIVDLGGGAGALSLFLLENGAQSALNIEKEKDLFAPKRHIHPRLSHFWGYFADFLREPQLAGGHRGKTFILSWPANNTPFCTTVIPLLELSSEIVYVGLNNGDTACGTAELWEFLVTRELLREIKVPQNHILHYRNQATVRKPTREEQIGLQERLHRDQALRALFLVK